MHEIAVIYIAGWVVAFALVLLLNSFGDLQGMGSAYVVGALILVVGIAAIVLSGLARGVGGVVALLPFVGMGWMAVGTGRRRSAGR
ncbi:MAG TPA: hypothetical protein VFG89_06900, partial [Coriobacteriia bacterium]|nr:hypothetical protein [Coriobacteriia bacterium]